MKIHKLFPTDGFLHFGVTASFEEKRAMSFRADSAEPMLEGWEPLELYKYPSPKRPHGVLADFDSTLMGFIVSAAAREGIESVVDPGDVEFLPCRFDDDRWLLHILRVIDALDLNHCVIHEGTIQRFGSPEFRRVAFKPERVDGATLFRITLPPPYSYLPRPGKLAGDAFVEMLHRTGLTGVGAEQLWDSEVVLGPWVEPERIITPVIPRPTPKIGIVADDSAAFLTTRATRVAHELNVDPDDPAETILEAIDSAIWNNDGSMPQTGIDDLAVLVGQQHIREHGWHWIMIAYPGEQPRLAVANTNHTAAIIPRDWIKNLLDDEAEPNITLNFNLIEADQHHPGTPGNPTLLS